MSDIALYRKYRPQQFKDVVGQEHIVSVLEGALSGGTTAHAYLFVGSRGTGKTSVARILARALGCESEDLTEIDAASNRGVDDVRALRDGVSTLPFRSPVKVYLIDEVHMLTREAFNALLKTLEEPPAHVVFILATTDFHKVPETIISRCEVHTFRRPSDETLSAVVKKIAKTEGLALTTEAAEFIALLGDGSFRDTLGVLQKVMSFSHDIQITPDEISQVTGAPTLEIVRGLTMSILDTKLDEALGLIRQAVRDNKDIKVLLKMLLRQIRLIMLLSYAPSLAAKMTEHVSVSEKTFLDTAKGHPKAPELPGVLRELLEAYELTTFAAVPELPLELSLIKLLANKNS